MGKEPDVMDYLPMVRRQLSLHPDYMICKLNGQPLIPKEDQRVLPRPRYLVKPLTGGTV